MRLRCIFRMLWIKASIWACSNKAWPTCNLVLDKTIRNDFLRTRQNKVRIKKKVEARLVFWKFRNNDQTFKNRKFYSVSHELQLQKRFRPVSLLQIFDNQQVSCTADNWHESQSKKLFMIDNNKNNFHVTMNCETLFVSRVYNKLKSRVFLPTHQYQLFLQFWFYTVITVLPPQFNIVFPGISYKFRFQKRIWFWLWR